MGQIVIAEYLTLDSVAEDPGPTGELEHRGWTIPYWNDELGEGRDGDQHGRGRADLRASGVGLVSIAFVDAALESRKDRLLSLVELALDERGHQP